MSSREALGAAWFAMGLLLVGVSVVAQTAPARPPDARVVPSGHGWWCVSMQAELGRCERTRAACNAVIESMPWGGIPPQCVEQPSAYCATFMAGQATSPPNPRYECRRDRPGCEAQLAVERTHAAPPMIFFASECGSVP